METFLRRALDPEPLAMGIGGRGYDLNALEFLALDNMALLRNCHSGVRIRTPAPEFDGGLPEGVTVNEQNVTGFNPQEFRSQ
jgi:hypothetical protein